MDPENNGSRCYRLLCEAVGESEDDYDAAVAKTKTDNPDSERPTLLSITLANTKMSKNDRLWVNGTYSKEKDPKQRKFRDAVNRGRNPRRKKVAAKKGEIICNSSARAGFHQ